MIPAGTVCCGKEAIQRLAATTPVAFEIHADTHTLSILFIRHLFTRYFYRLMMVRQCVRTQSEPSTKNIIVTFLVV
jgi:hypothetical protein